MRIGAAAVVAFVSLVACATPASARTDGFGWPLVPRPHVVTAFDLPDQRWLPGHRGVDLAAEPDAVVLAAGDGVVVYAGTVAAKPVVSIEHEGGLRTTYEPVLPGVSAGDRVRRGQPIGALASGHPGCPVSACLHWGLRRDREYLDPTALVNGRVVRLEPVVTSYRR
ncbi:M23 family metallopeptidase [Actinomycetes bacterium M1A6_2h]